MPQSLSPKKYIETKVRSLPIYKCLVNADWEETGMANVIVLRQHVNGNVSGGIYLVDLQCLGVKDTTWFFNEVEQEIMERFEGAGFDTINYNLAHNIIYAGHDFAMDYDIHPHENFKTSHFVLEEDDERIPIIEIKTGYGEDGIPHLMAYQPGQYADALAKLKKNAGEGNYLYTVGMDDISDDDLDEEDLEDDELDEDLDEDDLDEDDLDEAELEDEDFDGEEDGETNDDFEEASQPLSNFEDGMLTLQNVQDVRTEDLADEAQLETRSNMEQMICITEMLLRTLPDSFFEEEAEWAEAEWELCENLLPFPNGITEADFEEWATAMDKYENEEVEENDDSQGMPEQLAAQYPHNPLVTTMLIANAIAANSDKTEALFEKWKPQHGEIPLFQLLEAFYELLAEKNTGAWGNIILNDSLNDAFPKVEGFSSLEVGVFHALQTIRNARLQNLLEAVQHYYLAAATDFVHILFLPMMVELLPPLQAKVMEEYKDEIEMDGEE